VGAHDVQLVAHVRARGEATGDRAGVHADCRSSEQAGGEVSVKGHGSG
jgi:hypothetical protein